MKKILIFNMILLIMLSFCGCKSSEKEDERKPVEINMPSGEDVNGYRKEKPDEKDENFVSAEEVTVVDSYVSPSNSSDGISNNSSENHLDTATSDVKNNDYQYCANKNTKVYHKIDCGSVTSMKDGNREYMKVKSEAEAKGYKPCSRCNP